MKEWIKNLLVLQAADLRTKKMSYRHKQIPREKKEIKSDLIIEQNKVNKAKEELAEAEKQIKHIETKITDLKNKIQSLNAKSPMIKKNDEYKALMSEIESNRTVIGGWESKQLAFMDELDLKKKNLASANKAYDYMVAESEESVEELDELAVGLKAQIDKMLDARKKLIKKVNDEVYPLYSRLIKKPGEPLSKIHNGTCGNCHLKLTPQTFNDAKKEKLTTCDSCGYLIYYDNQ